MACWSTTDTSLLKLSLLLYLDDGYEIQSYRHKDGLSFPVNFLFCFLMFLELHRRNWLLPNTHRVGGNRKCQYYRGT